MQIIHYPAKDQWAELMKRPTFDDTTLLANVQKILDDVKSNGDDALRKYAKAFDKAEIASIEVSKEERDDAAKFLPPPLKEAIEMARRNIWKFHNEQVFESKEIQTSPDVYCWQKAVPIEKVGLYIPGGSAPLFSTVLMLAIPAQIAECKEIILCTPPNAEGKIHPAILHAANVAGVHRVFKAGGAQAIGAMA